MTGSIVCQLSPLLLNVEVTFVTGITLLRDVDGDVSSSGLEMVFHVHKIVGDHLFRETNTVSLPDTHVAFIITCWCSCVMI